MTPLFIGLWEGKADAVETIKAQENLDFFHQGYLIYGKSYAEVCYFLTVDGRVSFGLELKVYD